MKRMKVAIVGGGAAGISAAHALLRAQDIRLDIELLEAHTRYGGRALTKKIESLDGFCFDMGAQFIQDPEYNPWAYIARLLGFGIREEPIDKSWCWVRTAQGWKKVDARGYEDGGEAPIAQWAAIDEVETSISESYNENRKALNLPVCNAPGNPNTQESLLGYGTSAFKPLTESAEPWQYLAADLARQKEREEGSVWLVPNVGVGRLVEEWGKKLEQFAPSAHTGNLSTYTSRLGNIVTRIKVKNSKVKIDYYDRTAPFGPTQNAVVDVCIVTVPATKLRDITFIPQLHQNDAIEACHVKLGSYKKLAFKLVPNNGKDVSHYIQDNTRYFLPDESERGVWQYYRPDFFPPAVFLAECAGDIAAALDQKNDDAVVNHFRSLFVKLHGDDLSNEALVYGGMTNWSKTDRINGAYSYTAPIANGASDLPDAYNARVLLGLPHEPIFFAGEALFTEQYGTIEGAYKTGEKAAQDAIALLRKLA
ncbi:FAD-dependent oxidoreductase [Trinickia caryophylli]|uniref:Tryptophan 2-monooxygenase n=1 Tax=Trinickia caryophylli TaxID=28094 RepID=A0A1X7CZC8_TRICW|nr:FAD-dependent oxidoreductase [Trinickia caryophylli]PMS13515.1 hypothetical protein C0Z17_04305 [Trinickia caryophylli]TRX13627.1 FAD-dependent oxidoreductase [Trinickia caryophylli]WQE15205.1 FAD-dependent oxidoreductase [Trinickia caryophylli]SMF05862.1 Monoamine oxidase [Trinickia caryophylli]GLU31055.1 hypothetical protein Busp01_08970 [Trinickia caryophylli]